MHGAYILNHSVKLILIDDDILLVLPKTNTDSLQYHTPRVANLGPQGPLSCFFFKYASPTNH